MAAFFADENFPLQVVEAVRRLGHDVLTTSEAGQSGKAVSDREILDLAEVVRETGVLAGRLLRINRPAN